MLFTDATGAHRFKWDPPDHTHLRVSADGYRAITTNAYHPRGQPTGRFDLALVPEGR